MSVRVSAWVWEHAKARGAELLVLLAIADSAEDDGTNAWPSVNYLARKVRMSERTVQRHLSTLAASGQITITRPGGGRASNRYSVLMTGSSQPTPRGDNLAPLGEAAGAPVVTPAVPALSPQRCQPCHPRGDTAVSPNPSYRRPETSKRRPAGKAGAGASGAAALRRNGSDWSETDDSEWRPE